MSDSAERQIENSAYHEKKVVDTYLNAIDHSGVQREIIFEELLSKPKSENLPLTEQEFYELSIEMSDDIWLSCFKVKETRARWSEIDRQVMWEEIQWECWPTYKKAAERCEEWRIALAAKGFSQSDMDY